MVQSGQPISETQALAGLISCPGGSYVKRFSAGDFFGPDFELQDLVSHFGIVGWNNDRVVRLLYFRHACHRFCAKFYPPSNQLFAYIAYLATFFVGFAVRPFGALFFGRIGDLVGRKYAFIVTLTIMGGATALVGALPTFATAGWFSPIILIILRVLQGLALGGEYGGAAVYVAEHVPDNRRGFYTSFIQITATLGLFVSIAVILGTQSAMTDATLRNGAGVFRSWHRSSWLPSRSISV